MKNRLFSGLRLAAKLRKKGNSNTSFEEDLLNLADALNRGQDDTAKLLADKVHQKSMSLQKRGFMTTLWRLFIIFMIAAGIVVFVPELWFEVNEGSSSSMLPTLKDRNIVLASKSSYGINLPFIHGHILFSEGSVARGDIVVIRVADLGIPGDGKGRGSDFREKCYGKRLVALPGDTVYFYGGDLYRLDKDESTVHSLKADLSMPFLEYLPCNHLFEGRVETQNSPSSKTTTYYFNLFNTPLARIEVGPHETVQGHIMHNGAWENEFAPSITDGPTCYREFYGINNFAFCRALLPEQVPPSAVEDRMSDEEALLWLEIHHSPSLPTKQNRSTGQSPHLQCCTTYLPLHNEHLQLIKQRLYTERFVVKNNFLRREDKKDPRPPSIPLPCSIPNGCYEFHDGKAFSVGFRGRLTTLSEEHPLYPKSPKDLAFWLNLGINFRPMCAIPLAPYVPSRFTYFKNGDLFFMGKPLMHKEDHILQEFERNEMVRHAKEEAYVAFKDTHGEPDNPITPQYIMTHGFRVPERHYLLLGDNTALSCDSRYFGPVREDHLIGTILFVLWPFGERFGWVTQSGTLPSIYTIGLLALAILSGLGCRRARVKRAVRILKQIEDSRGLQKHSETRS